MTSSQALRRAVFAVASFSASAGCILFERFGDLAAEEAPVEAGALGDDAAADDAAADDAAAEDAAADDAVAIDGGALDVDVPPPPDAGTQPDSGPPFVVGAPRFVATWKGLWFGHALASDGDDTFLAASATGTIAIGDSGVDAGERDIVLAKVEPSGHVTWARTFGGTGGSGGNAVENPAGVAVNGSNLYVDGQLDSQTMQIGGDVLTRTGNRAAFVVKADRTNGALAWGRVINSAQPNLGLLCFGLAASATGVAVGCSFEGSSVTVGSTAVPMSGTGTGKKLLVAFFDPSGTLQWTNVFWGTGDQSLTRLAAYPNGDLLLAANVASPRLKDVGTPLDVAKPGSAGVAVPYLARVSGTNGSVVWSRFLGTGSTRVNGVAVSRDGSRVAAALTFAGTIDLGVGPVVARGSGDGAVIVIDEVTRATKWMAQVGGSNPSEVDDAYAVAFDGLDEIAIAGVNRSTDSTVGTTNVPSPPQNVTTGWGAFAAKLSASGDVLWAKGLSTQAFDDAVGMHDVVFTKSGDMHVGGGLQGTAPLDGITNVSASPGIYQQVLWGWGP